MCECVCEGERESEWEGERDPITTQNSVQLSHKLRAQVEKGESCRKFFAPHFFQLPVLEPSLKFWDRLVSILA